MLKPLLNRAVVKMIENEDVTKGGIILSGNSKENSQMAEVLEIASGGEINGKEVKMYIKKGDKIILSKYSGTEIKYQGEDLIIVKQDDVLAIIE